MTEESVSEATITIIPLSDVKQIGSTDVSEEEKEGGEKPISVFGQWEEWPNDKGVSYFFNKETGESQWEDPRLAAGAAAAASAILGSPMIEVKQDSKREEEKIAEKRYLVRDESKHKWELNDIESMKNDMLAQMQMLQDETRKSGARMPTLRKKYRPVRAPPTNPNPELSKRLSGSLKHRPSNLVSVVERPSSLPPIPLPNIPKTLPPTAPPTNPMDFPSSVRGYSRGSLSMEEMNRSRSADAPTTRGRNKKRSSQRSVTSDYLTTGAVTTLYVAVSEFTSKDESKLELKEGDYIIVQKKKSSGWWVGKNQETGRSGFFPGSYVKRCQVDRAPMRRSKSQEVSDRKARMWSGKLLHERSKRRSARARLSSVAQIRKRRSTRMGE